MEETITSRRNPLLAHTKKLLTSRAYREKSGEFAADGVKLLAEAARWYPGLHTVIAEEHVELCKLSDTVRVVRVPRDVMQSVSLMDAPQGAIFLCRLPERKPGTILPGTLLLDGIQDDGSISEEARNLVMQDLRAHFRPEFLNRIDETIMFLPLNKEEIEQIVMLQIGGIKNMLADNGITLQMTDEAIRFIASTGYDPEFGARPVKRAIQRYLLNDLSKKLLSQEVDRSKPIIVETAGDGLIFRN